jgi:hypothetical protein
MASRAACHEFVVDLDPVPDGLIRLLSPFAAQQARVVAAGAPDVCVVAHPGRLA